MKILVKIFDHLLPVDLPVGHIVKLIFYIRRKFIVKDLLEVLHEVVINDHAQVSGEKFGFLTSEGLGLCFRAD
ncbi:hypothetical protein D9M69_634990 [compost metagenome]